MKKKSNFSSKLFSGSGFTLSEVLITIVIIGVVAGLILPPLVSEINDAQNKVAWKKDYAMIVQAYLMVKQDHGGDLSDYFSNTVNYASSPVVQEMGNYLSVLKSCDIPFVSDYWNVCVNGSPAIANSYKTLSGGYLIDANLNTGQYVLSNGAHIYFRTYNVNAPALIWVDVNGFGKKPNTVGKDLYGALMTKDKIVPMGAVGTGTENTCNTTATVISSAYGFHGSSDISGAGCSLEAIYK